MPSLSFLYKKTRMNSLLRFNKRMACFCNSCKYSAGIGISLGRRLLFYCIQVEHKRNTAMNRLMSRLRRFFAAPPEGTENSAQRIIESILPVASLYGVDIATIDPEWFHEQTQR